MEKEKENLQEQEAPLKNTDNAYVKVGKDGAPEFPDKEKEKGKEEEKQESTTTIHKR
jgi:hypothetical protein